MQIQAVALEPVLYRPYGDVIAAGDGIEPKSANAGTARRFDRLAALENLRPGIATPNLCLFRVEPAAANPFQVRMLERHRHSTQAFIPMGAERYLVVVCGGGDAPDLSTLKAFVATGAQGITYRPGTWHHPLIALDRQTDFACLVHEDDSQGDCDVANIASVVTVALENVVKTPEQLLRDGEDRLNKAFADYEFPPSSTLAREFYELRIQAAIFNYDVISDMTTIWRNRPTGFAEKVALKGLVHKLYEYDQLLSRHLTARLLVLARARHIVIDSSDIKAERRKWKGSLKLLKDWANLRNQATGHYGRDIDAQVSQIRKISRNEVMSVAAAFLSFNIAVLKVLRNAGRGGDDPV